MIQLISQFYRERFECVCVYMCEGFGESIVIYKYEYVNLCESLLCKYRSILYKFYIANCKKINYIKYDHE